MEDPMPLLDTPKRKVIQSRADTLRAALKDFERSFAAKNDGRKPSKDDIKADAVVAANYKEYNKVRDVLAGKLHVDALHAPPPPRRKHEHTRTDSAISLTPRRPRRIDNTPSKARLHPNEIDPYDAPSSVSPKVMPSAIGPTPRRDGTVLGLFDLLPRSGSARSTISGETPPSRKRKIDSFDIDGQDGDKGPTLTIAQTPSQRRSKLAEHETGFLPTTTPRSHHVNTGRRQHSKTPLSEGKRFMLNHFFATPSAVRFATMIDADNAEIDAKTPAHRTPLRDTVLGLSPSKDDGAGGTMDATPPYLKRSFSFKERLLSASAGSTAVSSSWKSATSPTARRAGPRTLRHGRFGPKPLSQMIADLQSQSAESESRDEHDDDLDALREMESTEVNVLVGESQAKEISTDGENGPKAELVRTWKKKGQKRTTRRVIMRPVKMKPAEAPKFVAAEDDDDDDEDELGLDNEYGHEDDVNDVSRVEETQINSDLVRGPESEADSDLDYLIAEAERDDDDEDEFRPDKEELGTPPGEIAGTKAKAMAISKRHQPEADILGKRPSKTSSGSRGKKEEEGAVRTINPNAHVHMNFRSLKIKNKNSKAKGRGRFGRGRR